MVLSNKEIHKALDEGWLILNPQPSPRFQGEDGAECPYQTSAVDLRLSDEISYLPDDLPINIDLRRGGFAKLFGPYAKSQIITEAQPFSLKRGLLVLGQTLERVTLPIGDDGECLAARIEGRSSYARSGLLVHFTAPTIHAGYDGTITLELYNMGPANILLFPGTPICQLILETVKGVPFPNESQFHGQHVPGGKI